MHFSNFRVKLILKVLILFHEVIKSTSSLWIVGSVISKVISANDSWVYSFPIISRSSTNDIDEDIQTFDANKN